MWRRMFVPSTRRTDLYVMKNFISIIFTLQMSCLYSVVYYIRLVDHSQDLVLNQNSVYFQTVYSCVIFYAALNFGHCYATDRLVRTGLFVHVCTTAFSCF